MLTKYCIICGKAFYTENHRAKYCSDECKKEGRKRARQKWEAKNPDYMKKWNEEHPDYKKEWTQEHPHYNRDKSRERRARIAAADNATL